MPRCPSHLWDSRPFFTSVVDIFGWSPRIPWPSTSVETSTPSWVTLTWAIALWSTPALNKPSKHWFLFLAANKKRKAVTQKLTSWSLEILLPARILLFLEHCISEVAAACASTISQRSTTSKRYMKTRLWKWEGKNGKCFVDTELMLEAISGCIAVYCGRHLLNESFLWLFYESIFRETISSKMGSRTTNRRVRLIALVVLLCFELDDIWKMMAEHSLL